MRRIFERHWLDVVRYVARRSTAVEPEDVAATVFQRAWEHLDEIDEDLVLPWLLRVARNKTVDAWRSAKPRLPSGADRLDGDVDRDPLPDEHAATVLALDLREALARLSEQDHEVLSLAYWEGLTAQEAATVLGCTTVTYRVRLHRARRRLRDAYERNPITTKSQTVQVAEEDAR